MASPCLTPRRAATAGSTTGCARFSNTYRRPRRTPRRCASLSEEERMLTIANSRKMERTTMVSRMAWSIVALGAGLLITSCNTDVINPGRVDDGSLFNKGAQTAMVTGAGRAVAQGMNWVSYTGAAVAREIHPAGSIGSFGIT